MFGKDFSRTDSNSVINSALNYGYSILLSSINREIVSMGYMTQFGLFHDNRFNQFNLSCDLMEPFRVFIDRIFMEMNFECFGTNEKTEILKNINNNSILIDGQKMFFNNAIKIYCRSILMHLMKMTFQG